jgi:hypothetical protein
MQSFGPKIAPNVVFATTHWVNPESEVLGERERQLQEAWRKIFPECQMARFMNTSESAWSIVESLLERAPIQISVIQKKSESSGKGIGKLALEVTV